MIKIELQPDFARFTDSTGKVLTVNRKRQNRNWEYRDFYSYSQSGDTFSTGDTIDGDFVGTLAIRTEYDDTGEIGKTLEILTTDNTFLYFMDYEVQSWHNVFTLTIA